MSNQIQVRRGTEAQRQNVIFAAGELVWCTDSSRLYCGDGVSNGGRPVATNDIPYVRNAFSQYFNQPVTVNTVAEALDFIFNFNNNVATTVFYGDTDSNGPISDVTTFFSNLTSTAWTGNTQSIVYYSNYTYRVFAYPASYGLLSDVQDPNFNNTSIINTYAAPQEVTYNGVPFYVYITLAQNQSTSGKTIEYVI